MKASQLTSTPKRLLPSVFLAMTGQTLISAMTYLAAKTAMKDITAVNLLCLRVFLSSLVFAGILLATKGRLLPPREFFVRILILGFLAGPLNQGFFLYGLSRSTAAHAALLYALTPIGVYWVSLLAGREKSTWHRWVGMVVAFVGVVVLLLGRGLKEAVGPLVGDAFILAAVAAWVLYTTEGKRFAEKYGPIRTTAWTMMAAALWLVPLAPWFLQVESWLQAPLRTHLSVGFLVVMTSVVSYLLWYYALSKVEASRVAIFANLQPVVTAALAWWWLGEPLGWEILVGGTGVATGVWLTQRVKLPLASRLVG